jgi:hypothetical protein
MIHLYNYLMIKLFVVVVLSLTCWGIAGAFNVNPKPDGCTGTESVFPLIENLPILADEVKNGRKYTYGIFHIIQTMMAENSM